MQLFESTPLHYLHVLLFFLSSIVLFILLIHTSGD